MWLLPGLVCGDREWRLPLSNYAAARITLALLDPCPLRRQQIYAEVLQRCPPLALWVVCRSERWKASPPGDWSELSAWLDAKALHEFAGLQSSDGASEDQRRRWDELAAGGWDDSSNLSVVTTCFRSGIAAEWLSSAGPAISPSVLRDESGWFPRWGNDDESPRVCQHPVEGVAASGPVRASAPQQWLASDPLDAALGAQLPAVIERMSRLNELESNFTATVERAKLESLRNLAYGAGHEINNPLANISTRAQALLQDEPNPERRRKLAAIASQALRAHAMLADLMLFANPPQLNLASWDAAELLRELHTQMLALAEQQGTDLRLDVPSELLIWGDRTQAAVAIQALLRNALEAVVSAGRIDVSVKLVTAADNRPSTVEIVVQDNGAGIAPHVRPHIFDPFYSGREAGRGLGFGLSKAWRIAQLHGGTLDVDSQPGRGMRMQQRLPMGS